MTAATKEDGWTPRERTFIRGLVLGVVGFVAFVLFVVGVLFLFTTLNESGRAWGWRAEGLGAVLMIAAGVTKAVHFIGSAEIVQ